MRITALCFLFQVCGAREHETLDYPRVFSDWQPKSRPLVVSPTSRHTNLKIPHIQSRLVVSKRPHPSRTQNRLLHFAELFLTRQTFREISRVPSFNQ